MKKIKRVVLFIIVCGIFLQAENKRPFTIDDYFKTQDIYEDPREVNNIVNKKASLGHEMKRELLALIKEYALEGIEGGRSQKDR